MSCWGHALRYRVQFHRRAFDRRPAPNRIRSDHAIPGDRNTPARGLPRLREVDEPRRSGFGHGALVGHPQSGWESYTVSIDDTDVVRLHIRVVWRPAAWWMRASGQFGRLALHLILRRNLGALDSYR
ncbi:MAG: DUF1990 family protein [Mycetocola sp.]